MSFRDIFVAVKNYAVMHPESVAKVKDYAVAHPKTSMGVGAVVAVLGIAAAIPATGVAAAAGSVYAAVVGVLAGYPTIASLIAGALGGAYLNNTKAPVDPPVDDGKV